MGIQFSDCVENIVGKEEIARYKQFLLFPQYFQKLYVFSSPEHNVLRMSYCDRSLSGVHVSVRPSMNSYLKNLLL